MILGQLSLRHNQIETMAARLMGHHRLDINMDLEQLNNTRGIFKWRGSMGLAPEVTQLVLKQRWPYLIKLICCFLYEMREILGFSAPNDTGQPGMRDDHASKRQNIEAVPRMNRGSGAEGLWGEGEGPADRAGPSPIRSYRPVQNPKVVFRVCCSLGCFGFLAFALLIFLLKSIHVSSKEVRVGHLKLDYFFGANHCANFPLAIRRSDETFVICWFEGLRVAFPGHRLSPPIVFL